MSRRGADRYSITLLGSDPMRLNFPSVLRLEDWNQSISSCEYLVACPFFRLLVSSANPTANNLFKIAHGNLLTIQQVDEKSKGGEMEDNDKLVEVGEGTRRNAHSQSMC